MVGVYICKTKKNIVLNILINLYLYYYKNLRCFCWYFGTSSVFKSVFKIVRFWKYIDVFELDFKLVCFWKYKRIVQEISFKKLHMLT